MPLDLRARVHPRVLRGFAVFVACGPVSSDGAGSTGTSNVTTSVSGTETGSPTSGPDATTSTTGEPASTSGEQETTGTTGMSGSSGGDEASTGQIYACTLENIGGGIAGALGDEVEDCGVVVFLDDAAAWQAAHDCALAAATEQRAFTMIAYFDGVDHILGVAYVAQRNRPYSPWKLFLDSESSCPDCPPEVNIADCTVMATPDCTVEPGNVCLGCVDEQRGSAYCPPI